MLPENIQSSNIPPGLIYLPNYISQDFHDRLLTIIDRNPWLSDLKRRVQHYGYKYDYTKRQVDYSMFLGNLPDWLFSIAQKLHHDLLVDCLPDQAIVNEYNPGQGIAPHVDCVPCFDKTIISLSLGSACVMEFARSQTLEKIAVKLEPCSLIVMQEEARYKWTHRIAPRKKDRYKGEQIIRKRRVSVTFRKVTIKY